MQYMGGNVATGVTENEHSLYNKCFLYGPFSRLDNCAYNLQSNKTRRYRRLSGNGNPRDNIPTSA